MVWVSDYTSCNFEAALVGPLNGREVSTCDGADKVYYSLQPPSILGIRVTVPGRMATSQFAGAGTHFHFEAHWTQSSPHVNFKGIARSNINHNIDSLG